MWEETYRCGFSGKLPKTHFLPFNSVGLSLKCEPKLVLASRRKSQYQGFVKSCNPFREIYVTQNF